MEAEGEWGVFVRLREVDPHDARGVVRAGREDFLALQHRWSLAGRGVGIHIKRSGFFLTHDMRCADGGEAGAGDGIEDFPFSAASKL